MQLNGSKSIRGVLATITAALLGSGAVSMGEQGKLESSILYYSESGRVRAGEGIVNISKQLKGDRNIGVKLTLDGLTGATPNGAAPSSKVQTFTGASGRTQNVVQPGVIPLDGSFRDMRFAVDANLSQPWNRVTTSVFGGHFSAEHDYYSFGVNSGITRDFNRKNTTLGLSGSYSHDIVAPRGSVPIPFAFLPAPAPPSEDGRESRGNHSTRPKEVFDVVFGVSQILDRKTIMRLNYSYNRTSGYLNDPYKILSVVNDQNSMDAGEPVNYVYESRPRSTGRQALYGQVRRDLSGNTIDLSYRYFWDNWGITSHTVDVFYRWQLGGDKALQPHLRWYHQSQANFYRAFLVDGVAFPQYASADTRLAKFSALTAGLQYSLPISGGSRLNMTAEYYTQVGDRSPPNAVGILRQYDLFPRMNVLMFRLGFESGF
jgi:hypothetical protein